MTNTPDDVAVPAEGWPTIPIGEQEQPEPVRPKTEDQAAEQIAADDEPADDEPANVDPKVENDSNWKPEGWVEGEQLPGPPPVDEAGDELEGDTP